MSRYQVDGDENYNNEWELWWSNVLRHIGGTQGQKVLHELRDALLALPEPKLINGRLADESGAVCTVGALALHRGIPADELAALIPSDLWDGYYEGEVQTEALGRRLGLKDVMSSTLAGTNDGGSLRETPEARYQRVLAWVESKLVPVAAPSVPAEEECDE